MGIMDLFRGIKRPDSGTAVLPPEHVRAAILGINRPTAPFVIRESGEGDQGELVAEWRVIDHQWHQVFAEARVYKAFRVSMRLDVENTEVRALDQEREVSWVRGVPSVSFSASAGRGRISQKSYSSEATPFYEHGESGQIYKYRFNTSEIKNPLKEAVLSSGWTWRSVGFGKL